ncbi:MULTISPECIES: hypothetical protein [Rhizobium]|uniref:hypothetical protein n=1 Tax=Rhizobium TaxID=379 RepID=UPI001146FD58|nr:MULTISPECIES: hypothetical protein [Rhizobium]QJS27174.1 hypothetical protein RLTA1_07625 [Rhizobium leguminosarum bv. trifolii TA1]QJX04745.1 hypothetical protein RLCC275e_07190 [Rhizobium brockwellii]UFW95914.1 hypothetical protein RlegTA1_07600 [Rhizobium ruizarguesonis]
MAITLTEVADSVLGLRTKLVAAFTSQGWPEDRMLNTIQGYLPAYSASFVFDYITFTADRIRGLSDGDMKKGKLGQYLATLPETLSNVSYGQLPSDPNTGFNGLMMTLQMINARLPTEAKGPVPLDWESVQDKSTLPKDLSRRLRAVEANLERLEPKSLELEMKISDIDAAHAAAEQLPEDLAELASKREEVATIIHDVQVLFEAAQKNLINIENIKDGAAAASSRIDEAEVRADKLVERSEQALRGSTGVGLATAFETRKASLSWAGSAWVIGLLAALIAAFLIGSERVTTLQALLKNDSPVHVIWMNLALTLFGVGGPIWFAWLSTKQIAVSFKLAEDYAFKAAVSRAYEGYRKEAIEIDPSLQKRLFSSALDRLEEAPIRLMEKETHSSPLQELLSNPGIRKSLESIPGIADKIIALIPSKGSAAVLAPAAAVAAAAGVLNGSSSKNAENAE